MTPGQYINPGKGKDHLTAAHTLVAGTLPSQGSPFDPISGLDFQLTGDPQGPIDIGAFYRNGVDRLEHLFRSGALFNVAPWISLRRAQVAATAIKEVFTAEMLEANGITAALVGGDGGGQDPNFPMGRSGSRGDLDLTFIAEHRPEAINRIPSWAGRLRRLADKLRDEYNLPYTHTEVLFGGIREAAVDLVKACSLLGATPLPIGSQTTYDSFVPLFTEQVGENAPLLFANAISGFHSRCRATTLQIRPFAGNIKEGSGGYRDLTILLRLIEIARIHKRQTGKEPPIPELVQSDLELLRQCDVVLMAYKMAAHFTAPKNLKPGQLATALYDYDWPRMQKMLATLTHYDLAGIFPRGSLQLRSDRNSNNLSALAFATQNVTELWRKIERHYHTVNGDAPTPESAFQSRVRFMPALLERNSEHSSTIVREALDAILLQQKIQPWRFFQHAQHDLTSDFASERNPFNPPTADELEELVATVKPLASRLSQSAFLDQEMGIKFREILAHPGFVGLAAEQMRESGLLFRFLPVLQIIRDRTGDRSIPETTDRHLVATAARLDLILLGLDKNCPRELLPGSVELSHASALYLAALTHDVGRGKEHLGADFAKASHKRVGFELLCELLPKLGFPEDEWKLAATLVLNHAKLSLLSPTDSRPNVIEHLLDSLEDPFELGIKKDKHFLNLLFLLTHADKSASIPGSWTAFSLPNAVRVIRETKAQLDGDYSASSQEKRVIAEVEAALQKTATDSTRTTPTSEAVLDYLHSGTTGERSDEILRDPESLIVFTDLKERLLAVPSAGQFAVSEVTAPVSNRDFKHIRLCYLGNDRDRLLASLCLTLAHKGLEIESAAVVTRADGLAANEFLLRVPGGQRLETLPAALNKILIAVEADSRDVIRQILERREVNYLIKSPLESMPLEILINTKPGRVGTNIVIETNDGDGLAGLNADAISSAPGLPLIIRAARLRARDGKVINSFDVTTANGDEIPHNLYEDVRRVIRAKLNGQS